jgi:glutamate-5-semialdehyde dehydrogenase
MDMTPEEVVLDICKRAKAVERQVSALGELEKNNAIKAISINLLDRMDDILKANKLDLQEGRNKGLSQAMLDRLMLNETRIREMAHGAEQVAMLPDPVGETIRMWKRPNGLEIGQRRVPLGVVGIIYEARPNVTLDAAVLCIKTGNTVILKGGSEAIHSNCAISDIMREALKKSGIPEDGIQLVRESSREAVDVMMRMEEYIDVLIPRGGQGLIKKVVRESVVPVIQTGAGNCHVFVDETADLKMAEDIVVNAKTQRPAVCNSMETLLVHEAAAEAFLPGMCQTLKNLGVEIRGCQRTKAVVPWVNDAGQQDWETEYDDLILAVKIVDSVDEAIDHIAKYSTGHSESIITRDYDNSRKFLDQVDSAAVYVNASTRFTDGFEFGFGAEIGISTQKLHARGPMGLRELTTTKYVIYGQGQIRE